MLEKGVFRNPMHLASSFCTAIFPLPLHFTELTFKMTKRGTDKTNSLFTTYHLPALLIVLSSAPQRAAHRAGDLLILWVVNSFPNRVLDIYEKMRYFNFFSYHSVTVQCENQEHFDLISKCWLYSPNKCEIKSKFWGPSWLWGHCKFHQNWPDLNQTVMSQPHNTLLWWIDQFQYFKIQSKTIDLSTRLRGITTEFVGFIPRSLVLRSIVLGWILIYWNWAID